MKILKTDLRAVTRSRSVVTTVELCEPLDQRSDWIYCGESSLSCRADRIWTFSARLDGMTDFDHDSGYAFRMALVGVEFDRMSSGVSYFAGWIDSSDDSAGQSMAAFRVPKNGEYDPSKGKGVKECRKCKGEDRHVFLLDGDYLPAFDQELYDAVKGKRVKITVGPK